MQVIREDVPGMAAWVAPELCTPTKHLFKCSSGELLSIEKSSGGDQGNAIVAQVFPLLYARPVRATIDAVLAHDQDARPYAYQDDLDIIHKPELCELATRTFKEACSRVGLRSNTSKETITPGEDVPASSLPAGVAIDPNPTVLRHGQNKIPLVPSARAAPNSQLPPRSDKLQAIISGRRSFLEKLLNLHLAGLSAQDTIALARARCNRDSTFFARTVGIPDDDASALDADVVTFVGRIGGQDHRVAKLVFIAQKDGGLGFISVRDSAPAAHASSWARYLPKIADRLLRSGGSPAAIISMSPWLTTITPACDSIIQSLTNGSSCKLGDASSQTPAASQKALARVVQKKRLEAHRESLTPPAQAALRYAGGPGPDHG